MKTVKRSLMILLAAVLLLLGLTSCKNVAVGLVESSTNKSVSMRFASLKGTREYSLYVRSGDTLHYTAKLGSGTATVYIMQDGYKEELFTLSGGEDVDDELSGLDYGTVYVIIETEGTCKKGNFKFKLE